MNNKLTCKFDSGSQELLEIFKFSEVKADGKTERELDFISAVELFVINKPIRTVKTQTIAKHLFIFNKI